MARISLLFVSKVYRAQIAGQKGEKLVRDLRDAAHMIAKHDRAGRAWSRDHDYPGYTSYASLDDLPERDSLFAALVQVLDGHAQAYARDLDFDLKGRRLVLDSLWINVLDPGGHHSAHIHPHSVISGTIYLAVPKGASAIKFEDPRLPMLMAAPPRKDTAREYNRTFVSVEPKAGTLLLWESWLRHEVPVNRAKSARVSLSFNYGLR